MLVRFLPISSIFVSSILLYTLWWTNIAIENGHRNSGFSHSKWWFSIAKLLVHQRVFFKKSTWFWMFIPRTQAVTSSAGSGRSGRSGRSAIRVEDTQGVLINVWHFAVNPLFFSRKKHVSKNANVGGICGYDIYPASIPIKNHKMVGLILLINPFCWWISRSSPARNCLVDPLLCCWKILNPMKSHHFSGLNSIQLPCCSWNPVKTLVLLLKSREIPMSVGWIPGKLTNFHAWVPSNHRFCWWNHFWIHGYGSKLGTSISRWLILNIY